jgi:heme-degrading monooxygenase HmoA
MAGVGDWRWVDAPATIGSVSIIKINAITVPADAGDELAHRFAARAGAVDGQDGFEGFELLKPTDDRTTWLVVTRWRDEAAFEAWLSSPAFAHGHRGAGTPAGEAPAPSGGGGPPGGAAGTSPAGHAAPVSTSSELWSYEVVLGAGGAAS